MSAETTVTEAPVPVGPFAFRCRECGQFHAAGHAGTSDVPHACVVCGAGVEFDPRSGLRRHLPDNWEVLAAAPPERLAELGLEPHHVAAHTPSAEAVRVENLGRINAAREQLTYKKARWESDHQSIIQQVWDAEDRLEILSSADVDDARLMAKLHSEKSKLNQTIYDLKKCEWTARDEAHLAELLRGAALGGHPPRAGGQSLKAGGADSVFSRNKA